MKPVKAKTLLDKTAEKTNLSVRVVEDVVDFYWQEIRRSMAKMSHPRIHLINLGDFVVKGWKLDERIKRIELFDQKNQQKGLQLINARFKTAETVYDLRQVQKIIEEEKTRASFIRLHKKTVNETKQHNTDMEGQGSDPGGSEK